MQQFSHLEAVVGNCVRRQRCAAASFEWRLHERCHARLHICSRPAELKTAFRAEAADRAITFQQSMSSDNEPAPSWRTQSSVTTSGVI